MMGLVWWSAMEEHWQSEIKNVWRFTCTWEYPIVLGGSCRAQRGGSNEPMSVQIGAILMELWPFLCRDSKNRF